MTPPFVPFRPIPRLSRACIITEKLDGTNACVHVDECGTVTAGSRSRWLSHENDNFGFAAWVAKHADELRGLGPGYHFGEWWGQGIQRGYGLNEKRFSLFNVTRWALERPACCYAVPVLARLETFDTAAIEAVLALLGREGSHASPGFMRPEGIVIFHVPSGLLFKKTLERDEGPKGLVIAEKA